MSKSGVSTHSVVLAHPIVDALVERGFEREVIAPQLGVSADEMSDPTVRVPASATYHLCEWAAEVCDEPLLAARVGQGMAAGKWAPMAPLFREATNVIDFLTRMSILAEKQGRAVSYRLEVEGAIALWKLARPPSPGAETRHVDALAVAFFVEILKRANGVDWNTDLVTVVTTDPSLIPADILPATSVMSGLHGVTLRFPSPWLSRSFSVADAYGTGEPVELADDAEEDTAATVGALIARSLDSPNFTIETAARMLGLKRWQLQSALQAEGTTFVSLRNTARRDRAFEALATTSDTIADIARSVGYSSVSNFARAFREWSGESPSEFRERRSNTNSETTGKF